MRCPNCKRPLVVKQGETLTTYGPHTSLTFDGSGQIVLLRSVCPNCDKSYRVEEPNKL